METYKVCPRGAIAPFSSCLQSIFNGKISADCPVTDIISPSTCISYLWRDTMAISMFGNGTMHFDLGKSQHLIKPELIDSFTVVQRKETRGTLFCKQSKHRHVSPDLEMPPIIDEQDSTWTVTEIGNFNTDLTFIKPVAAQINGLANKLSESDEYLKKTETALNTAQNNSETVFGNFKRHVTSTLDSVENELDGIYTGFVIKILLPPLGLIAIGIIGWKFLLKRRISSRRRNPNSSGLLNSTHDDSRHEQAGIAVTTE